MEKKLLKYTLRLDKELFRKIKYIADDERRSVNREIEYIIKISVKRFEAKYGKIDLTYFVKE